MGQGESKLSTGYATKPELILTFQSKLYSTSLFNVTLKQGLFKPVSLFEYSVKDKSADNDCLNNLKNAVQKLKTLRHPRIIKFHKAQIDDSKISVLTEKVEPLCLVLNNLPQEEVCMGLYGILKALHFLHSQEICHNNLQISSIYISKNKEKKWLLSGMEFVKPVKEMEESFMKNLANNLPKEIIPPEDNDPTLRSKFQDRDYFALGILITHIIEPFIIKSVNTIKNTENQLFKWRQLQTLADGCISMNPLKRYDAEQLLESQFFENNSFIQITEKFLMILMQLTAAEKQEKFLALPSQIRELPMSTVAAYILPLLLTKEMFSEPNVIDIFRELFSCPGDDSILSVEVYQSHIVPFIKEMIKVKTFDVRLTMLKLIEFYFVPVLNYTMGYWMDSVIEVILVGLEDSNDDLYYYSLKSLMFVIPTYIETVILSQNQENGVSLIKSGSAKSIHSDLGNDESVSNSVDELSSRLPITSLKKYSIDVLINRVTIPHMLNIFVSPILGEEKAWGSIESCISMWKTLHLLEKNSPIKSSQLLPIYRSILKSFQLVLKASNEEKKLIFLEKLTGKLSLENEYEFKNSVGASAIYIIELIAPLLNDLSFNVRNLVSDTIKKLTEFQLHNNNEADTEDNVNYNSSCDKMLEKMSKVYSSKLSRNKQTVSRIGPRIHSTEASHKSIPLKQTNSSSGLSPISKSAGNSPAVESFDSWNDTWQQEDNSSNNDSVGTPTSFAIDNFSLDTDQDEWTAPTAEVDDPAKLLEREKEKQLRLAAREARQAELKKKRELKKKNNILVATKSSESLQNLSNNSATSSPTSVSSPVKGAEISKNLLTEEDETKKNLEKLIAMKKEEETKSPMLGYNNSFTNTSSPAEPKSPPQVDYFSDMTPTFKAPVVLNVASGTLSNSPSMEFVDAVTDTPFPSRVTYQPEGTEEVSGGWGDDL